MRYVVAMVFAIIAAALAIIFMSSSVADWVVGHMTFESPDDADNLHMLTFIGANIVALLIGWMVGWIIGGSASSKPPAA
jgi:hypothetical protein